MADIKTCVVCGAASHRGDWINKSGDYVACDSHSTEQLANAVKKAVAPPAPAVTKASVTIPKV